MDRWDSIMDNKDSYFVHFQVMGVWLDVEVGLFLPYEDLVPYMHEHGYNCLVGKFGEVVVHTEGEEDWRFHLLITSAAVNDITNQLHLGFERVRIFPKECRVAYLEREE